MTSYSKTDLVLDKTFDAKSSRHIMNGQAMVLHCHHYVSLYSQLALDCELIDAKTLLSESSEDTWEDFLKRYYRDHRVTSISERFDLAEQAFAAAGLGKMRVTFAGEDSGEVDLERSHVDEGWIQKWGKTDKPVNYLSAGFIAGMFSAVFGHPARTYAVSETQSIVTGADFSRFAVVVR